MPVIPHSGGWGSRLRRPAGLHLETLSPSNQCTSHLHIYSNISEMWQEAGNNRGREADVPHCSKSEQVCRGVCLVSC